jgi:hypothetical protein
LPLFNYFRRIKYPSSQRNIIDIILGTIWRLLSKHVISTILNSRRVEYMAYNLKYQLVKKKRINSKLPIKVIFIVTDSSLWCAQSVYDSLHEDPKFYPIIVALYDFIGLDRIPDSPKNHRALYQLETLEKNYSFFKKHGMKVVRGYIPETRKFFDLQTFDPDVVFYELPYYSTVPESYRIPIISQYALTCYIPYGYKIAKRYQEHFNLYEFSSIWRIFAESEMHGKLFKQYSEIKGKNVVTTGYPKLDVYLSKEKPSPHKYWKIAQPDVKRIIWAPHWTINDKVIAFSTFHKNYNFFLTLAMKYKNIEWVFKPHQELYPFCIREGLMTVDEANAYYKKWNTLPNTTTYLKGGYFDLFKTSDALITCCGSFLAEYLPTGKPVLYLANPKSIGFNIVGQQIINGYYRAETNDEIEEFIVRVILKQDDYLKEKRLANMSHVAINRHGAGKAIKNHIMKELSKKVERPCP